MDYRILLIVVVTILVAAFLAKVAEYDRFGAVLLAVGFLVVLAVYAGIL